MSQHVQQAEKTFYYSVNNLRNGMSVMLLRLFDIPLMPIGVGPVYCLTAVSVSSILH